MLKPSNPLTTLRQFVRGVCALPQVAAAASELRTWLSDDMVRGLASEGNEQRDRITDLERQLAEAKSRDSEYVKANAELYRQLTAEREAHAAKLVEIGTAYDELSSGYLARAEAAESERDSIRAQLDRCIECAKRAGWEPDGPPTYLHCFIDALATDRDTWRADSEKARALLEKAHADYGAQLDAVTKEEAAWIMIKNAWSEGFESGAEFASHQSTPAGNSIDPPPNPYARDLAVNEEEPSCDCDRDPACARCSSTLRPPASTTRALSWAITDTVTREMRMTRNSEDGKDNS